MNRFVAAVLICFALVPPAAHAQQYVAPFRESFDTTHAPLLPVGWSTTKAKSPTGDFTASSATPRSAPLAALSTDARVAQCLTSPALSFAGKIAGVIGFFERRSSSYTAGMLVEASIRGDSTSWMPISDTLTLISSSAYIFRSVQLPASLDNQPFVRFRWRTLGNGSGATGTLRIDDVDISVQRSVDLALDSLVLIPPLSSAGIDVPCTVTLRNRGQDGVYACSLSMIDSTLGSRRIADSTFTHAFTSADSFSVTLLYPRMNGGIHRILIVLTAEGDEDTTNNFAVGTIAGGFPAGTVVINEIMYDPPTGKPEYVELFNRSDANVNLGGWNMGDASGTVKQRATIPLPERYHSVPPKAMCVVAADSSVVELMKVAPIDPPNIIIVSSLGLNNSGDDIILFDPSGSTVDSVRYAPGWHLPKISTAGKSLERINPNLSGNDARNWSTSVAAAGGTPGSQNSVFTSAIPTDASLVLTPNPFSPNNDGVEDFLGITYLLPSAAADVRVRIYDSVGRLVRTLANNEPAASTGTIMWNGRDDSNTRVRMGMYIVFVEAVDPRGGVLRAMKGVAVVATTLN